MRQAKAQPKTPLDRELLSIAEGAARIAAEAGADEYTRFADDPVGFAEYVWPEPGPDPIKEPGFRPWYKQVEVVECLMEHRHIAVPAGRAVGKSRLNAWIALWFAICVGGRVILTMPTQDQIQNVLWEEIKVLARLAKRKLPIEIAEKAETGARADNGGQILGRSATQPEAFQGIRGPRMLLIADEASGIKEELYHVIDGNIAGGAYLMLTGNPTRTSGYFRESLRSKWFHVVTISSLDSPNVKAGREVVPGLAMPEFVEKAKENWGEDSSLYKIHVLGKPVEAEEGQLFPLDTLAGSHLHWAETPATGRLVIGVDPAGDSGMGDESAFACRRGLKIVHLEGKRGLTAEAHLVKILGLIAKYKGDSNEVPLVSFDNEGEVGWKVGAVLKAHAESNPDDFVFMSVRGSKPAQRKPLQFDKLRDEMFYNLADHFRAGLKVPDDFLLDKDLSTFRSDATLSGKSTVTKKKDIKIHLDGRSPDRADALALACMFLSEWQPPVQKQPFDSLNPYVDSRARGIDPYAALSTWGRR